MAGNSLENDIIDLYSNNPSSLYSINQIATKLGKKYPYINKKVTTLIKEEIFTKTIVGRSHLCSLNLQNDETIGLLALCEITRKKRFLAKNPALAKSSNYIQKLSKAPGVLSILHHNKNIIFITEDNQDKESLSKAIISSAISKETLKILSKDAFQEELKSGTNIHEDHIILHGFEAYYNCIKEIEDILRIKNSRLVP